MDVADQQMQLTPAEFKYQDFVNRWNSVNCIADIDLKFQIPVTSEKSRFENMIFVSKAMYLYCRRNFSQHIFVNRNKLFKDIVTKFL